MGRTLRLNCPVCTQPHVLDEEVLFGSADLETVEYVALAGTDQEHTLLVKRPPSDGERPRLLPRLGPFEP